MDDVASSHHEFTVWLWREREDLPTWSSKLVELGSGPRSTIMKLLGRIGRVVDLKEEAVLMVFRQHIMPMWEDPGNMGGGRWRMDVKESQLTRVFIYSLLSLFSSPSMAQVSGIYLRRRRDGGRIDLWCGVIDNAVVQQIGLAWHRVLQLREGRMQFRPHCKGNTSASLTMIW